MTLSDPPAERRCMDTSYDVFREEQLHVVGNYSIDRSDLPDQRTSEEVI